jgi:enoyl-[acyl-carrier protein] reductase II
VIVNRYAKPAMRTLRTERSAAAERDHPAPPLSLEGILDLYFGGSMEAAYAMSGQVAGRITDVLPVREILEETWRGCRTRLQELAARASD